jgi:APA family basic amino acid/polyamine antiporter
MNANATRHSRTPTLVRGLGLWSAIAVVIGSMLGQAVFLVGSDMARELGSVTRLIAAWIVGGIVVLFAACCYAELGAAMPKAGGEYVYLSRGLSPVFGFLFGWTRSMIMSPGMAAVIAAGVLRFFEFLFPVVAAPIFTWHVTLFSQSQPYEFTLTAGQPLAAAMIVLLATSNYLGVRMAGRFQVVLTSLKVAALVAIIIFGLLLRNIGGEVFNSYAAIGGGGLGSFLMVLVPVMAAYNGFQCLGCIGEEIANPQKNIPRAAIFGSLVVISLYVLVNWTYFRVLGLSRVAQSHHVASDTMLQLIGSNGAKWITVGMIISALGALHSNFLAYPRVPFAMARDGYFFAFAKRIQPNFHTPSGAIFFQACIAVLLVLTGTYEELYSFEMFAIWLFFTLTAVAVIRLRRIEPNLARPYRVWGYPWTPLFFGTAALAISANLWLTRPVRSSIGLAIILLGAPFFYYWQRRAIRVPIAEAAAESSA